MDVSKRVNNWFCINNTCNHVLGVVRGSELNVSEDVPGSCIQTRGANLSIVCPKCGTTKIWYTSDPIVRAVYQFIDATITAGAHRFIMHLGEQRKNLTNDPSK